jgi:hypothetical protein
MPLTRTEEQQRVTKTLQPPSDPYEFQTYKILMQRGVTQAEAIKKAQFWGALKRTDPTGKTVVGPADYAADVAQIDAKNYGNLRQVLSTRRRRRRVTPCLAVGCYVTSGLSVAVIDTRHAHPSRRQSSLPFVGTQRVHDGPLISPLP